MSDEYNEPSDQSAAVAEAPSASVDATPASGYQSESRASEGFETPFAAFRHLPDFAGQDDLAIAQNLYRAFNGYQNATQQLQQYQTIVPAGMDYLRNQKEFEAWRRSQAEASKPKAEEAPKWWSPPQVKDTWKGYIVRDPSTGKEVIDPSAPYEAQQALREYQAYTADFARKFVTDPENTLKPFVEQVAMQKAQELVQQQLGQYQATNYVSDLERQNADWLYDQTGNISREGQAIQAYIQQASEIGITSPEARWKYATGMLQRDLLNVRYQQMQSAPPQYAPEYAPQVQADPVAAQNMQFLRERATRTPNRSAGTTEPRAPRQRMSFEDRLRGQLVNDGVI
jgi:hypothetical protein